MRISILILGLKGLNKPKNGGDQLYISVRLRESCKEMTTWLPGAFPNNKWSGGCMKKLNKV